MKYTLLIDVTLSAINTTLVDENHELSQQTFTLSQSAETVTAEQIVTEVLAAIKKVQATLTNDDFIEAITFAEITLDSLVPFDDHKKALMPINYGHDTQKYIDALMMNGVIGQLERKTGLVFQEVTPLMQILWLKNEQPEIFAKVTQYMNVQSYIIYRLFDLQITSPAAAGRTGFYNLVKQAWDDQALALSGLTTENLPQVVDFNAQSLSLTSEMRTYLGISEDTIFHVN
ncbi:FGGY family carbohydrate kinase [Weissella bombi]|uniref:FGGY family of carbohydrate kinases, N-terminal domain n=1 Tax=Weissella bombi TaxID=1505725 RepID=A0A1C4BXF3_9LACO|nr:FGGY family carbohydrate kinase [Weissella bombi]SCC11537.1 FGGY family of carbohydrate kinases, N-terminal domain [Weissella bombi]